MNWALRGKRVVITGATSGIGKQAAIAFSDQGAEVIALARDAQKCEALKSEIGSRDKNANVQTFVVDLSDMAQVRDVATRIESSFDRIDVLVNNAGGVFTHREESADGFEMTFALNHLSYFLLTNRLLPLVIRAQQARIVNVASEAHRMIDGMRWDDLQMRDAFTRRGWDAYCQSKLANILFTYELSRRLKEKHVTVNCLHPGFVRTGLGKNNGLLAKIVIPLLAPFARSPQKGAETTVWAASSAELSNETGRYLMDSKISRSSEVTADQESWTRLWRISEELVGD
ncbi:MAG: SDR family oxidoreductase [Polyangiales bacterium]